MALVWSGWESRGGVLTSAPHVVSWGPGRLDVFARGADSAIWHKAWDGGEWADWESRGGGFQHGPMGTAWSVGRIDLMSLTHDGMIWHKAYGADSDLVKPAALLLPQLSWSVRFPS
jgi:hypothetical protein